MPAPMKVSPITVTRVAEEILRAPFPERDRWAVANLLQDLASDMEAMRRMDVGAAEPAVTYAPEVTAP